MLCQRCQRHLRNCEGLKCSKCESKYHLKCADEYTNDHRNSGDRAYQWKCALCQKSETKIQMQCLTVKEDALMNAINAISEKFELINKIQLPKLSNEVVQLKSMTDNVVRQNERILRKMDAGENKNNKSNIPRKSTAQTFRKRSINLPSNNAKAHENKDNIPILLTSDKTVKFRSKRRSYTLNKMFHLLNRKLNKTSPPLKRF